MVLFHRMKYYISLHLGNESCTFFVNGTQFRGKPEKINVNEDEVSVFNPPFGSLALIGNSDIHGNKTLNGLIDEFYLYNKTLTEKKIQALMKCNKTTTVGK